MFHGLFRGLPNVYGTYDPRTGRVRQVKAPVDEQVVFRHLAGRQPYGVYLLQKDRTRALALDFDRPETEWPMAFIAAARHYGLAAYLERSKSKGYHAWIFFEEAGISAHKARRVALHILHELNAPLTEIFPKQDTLDGLSTYGNFINAPLFGRLVLQGRTVFVHPQDPEKPYANQWELLASVQRVPESALDEIIEINDLNTFDTPVPQTIECKTDPSRGSFALPPCARRMLAEGVSLYQRVACFRLAVHCKRIGLPQDLAVSVMQSWASKNTPPAEKRIITDEEILAQVRSAYAKDYRGCGCEDPAIAVFCSPDCRLYRKRQVRQAEKTNPRARTES